MEGEGRRSRSPPSFLAMAQLKLIPLCLLALSCRCEVKISSSPVESAQPVPKPAPSSSTSVAKPAEGFNWIMASHALKVGTDPGVPENVVLAAAKVNGYKLTPGAEFSFNRVVGERTSERGFKVAKTLFEGAETQDYGGGVCQVSTGLYMVAMTRGLEILERHPHSTPRSYVGPGEDASVNWPDLDLRFKNNTQTTVEILTSVEDGVLMVALMAPQEDRGARLSDSRWVASGPTPYETRRIPSLYVTKTLKHRKGVEGTPGYRLWYYGDRTVRVQSNYKPISEVLVVPASVETVTLGDEK